MAGAEWRTTGRIVSRDVDSGAVACRKVPGDGANPRYDGEMRLKSWVFLLWHVHGEEDEDPELVGAYSSQAAAVDAVRRLGGKPGFRDRARLLDDDGDPGGGFFIAEYELDKDTWPEGHAPGGELVLEAERSSPLDWMARPMDASVDLEDDAATRRVLGES